MADKNKEMKCCFIGHRRVCCNISDKLLSAIQNEIDNGCRKFIVGTHGQFDELALSACKEARRKYNKDIAIEVAITSINQVKSRVHYYDDFDKEIYTPYSDVKTFMYEIEETHYKQKITVSNKKMVNDCDRMICYVDVNEYRSGAKTAMCYAQKCGLKITNLFREEEQPFYGLTKDEAKAAFMKMFENSANDRKNN